MSDRGWHADICLVRHNESATAVLEQQLATAAYDGVVIGGGLRIPFNSLPPFERLINAVHEATPEASITFNTAPPDTADAAARWLDGLRPTESKKKSHHDDDSSIPALA